MSQSTVIAGAIFFTFLVYITNRGQLGTYIGILL